MLTLKLRIPLFEKKINELTKIIAIKLYKYNYIRKSKETVNKSWIHYVSMAFEDNLNKYRAKSNCILTSNCKGN